MRNQGFTLIEIVTTTAITGIVAVILGVPLMEGIKTRNRFNARQEILSDARSAIEIVTRDIRVMSKTGSAPDLSTAAVSQIDFGTMSYRLSGTTLQRSGDSGSTYKTMLEDVSTLTFSYEDEDGGSLSSLPLSSGDRDSVRRVQVDITVTRNGEELSLRSRAYLRTFAF